MTDPRTAWTTSRLVSGMQYLAHPDTGETLLDLDALLASLRRRKLITRYAVIVHEGTHVHWVAACDKKGIARSQWARWFDVPEDRVWRIVGGEDGLADALLYTLHRGAAGEGKTPYDPADVTATPGWDWEALIRAREIQLAVVPGARRHGGTTGMSVTGKVLSGALTVEQARRQTNIDVYKLRDLRAEYLRSVPPPPLHINVYVQHCPGPDREPFARALAQALTGTDSVFVPGRWWEYDGEDCVMWIDRTPAGMAKSLGGRVALFQSLRSTPGPQDRAWAKVTRDRGFGNHTEEFNLVHRTTVVVSSQPFDEFRAELEALYDRLTGIGGTPEYEAAAAMPLFVPVEAETFGVQLLSQFIEPTRAVGQYSELARIANSFADIERAVHAVPEHERPGVARGLHRRQFGRVIEAADAITTAVAKPMTAASATSWADRIGLGEGLDTTNNPEGEN